MSENKLHSPYHLYPGVEKLQPYQPGKPVSELARELGLTDIVKLASNENPLGPSPRVVEAIKAASHEITRYPDGGGFELREAISAKYGVESSGVTLGNGSNDVLELIARAFLGPGAEAIFSEYAFAVYPLVTQASGAKGVVAPACAKEGKWAELGHDLDAMLERVTQNTRVVFIANPNNPTGTYIPAQQLRAFVEDLPESIICVIDEAYFEYVSEGDYPDTSVWLKDFPNLIVTRTFSKAYGLAGLRVGYALSSGVIADYLNRVRQPFNTNSLAQVAAITALQDEDYIQRSAQANNEGLKALSRQFSQWGVSYIPSVGNFICVEVAVDSADIYEKLLRQGVIVRPVANYGLPRYLRVSVGTEKENQRFLDVFHDVAVNV